MEKHTDPFKQFERENMVHKDPSLISQTLDEEEDDLGGGRPRDTDELLKQINDVDFYALLNIARDANVEEIKIAYKRLAFTYHPDKQVSEELKEQTQEKFSLIAMAKDTLCDPRLRAIYDEFGLEGLKNSKALVNKYEEIETLIRALEQVQKQAKEDKYLQDVFAHGSQAMKVSYNHEYRLFQFNNYRSMQTFKFSSRAGVFDFTPSLKLDRSHGVVGVDVGYSYPISNNHHFSLTNQWSDQANVTKVGLTSLLRPNLLGSFHCNLLYGIPFEAGVELSRNFSESVQGKFLSSFGFAQGLVGVNVTRSIEKRVLDFTLVAGTQSGFEATLTRKIALAKGTTVGGSISAHQGFSLWDHGLLSVSAFVQKKVNRVFHVSLSMNISDARYMYTLGFHHKYQSFEIPLPIYTDISLLNSFLFFTVPSVAIGLVKALLVNPFLKRVEHKKSEEMQKVRNEATLNSKRKAEIDIKLMTPTVQKKVTQEQAANGLIVQEALYGVFSEAFTASTDPDEVPPYIDVTIPMQYLVDDHKLSLHANKKSDLLGFYDPRPNEDKHLKVTYYFRGSLHKVTISEDDSLVMPLRSHLIK